MILIFPKTIPDFYSMKNEINLCGLKVIEKHYIEIQTRNYSYNNSKNTNNYINGNFKNIKKSVKLDNIEYYVNYEVNNDNNKQVLSHIDYDSKHIPIKQYEVVNEIGSLIIDFKEEKILDIFIELYVAHHDECEETIKNILEKLYKNNNDFNSLLLLISNMY